VISRQLPVRRDCLSESGQWVARTGEIVAFPTHEVEDILYAEVDPDCDTDLSDRRSIDARRANGIRIFVGLGSRRTDSLQVP
jgi:hypothetical protein